MVALLHELGAQCSLPVRQLLLGSLGYSQPPPFLHSFIHSFLHPFIHSLIHYKQFLSIDTDSHIVIQRRHQGAPPLGCRQTNKRAERVVSCLVGSRCCTVKEPGNLYGQQLSLLAAVVIRCYSKQTGRQAHGQTNGQMDRAPNTLT